MCPICGNAKTCQFAGSRSYPSDRFGSIPNVTTVVNFDNWKGAQGLTPQPMELAREYVELTRVKRRLDRELAAVKKDIEEMEPAILELIESEQLPHSFKLDGANVFTREQVWASPLDGDHAALSAVLADLDLVEYLPKTVNSHSISAYVREHLNEAGEIEGIDPRLLDQLKVTRQTKAVVTG